jgi:hypothetical protein
MEKFKICLEGEYEGMSEINVNLSFTVNPATQPLSVTVVSPPPAMTVGVALPSGSAVANVTGGVPPYTGALDPSSQPLPPGITLSFNAANVGEIDAVGTPTTAGMFSGVILDVTDSASSAKKLRF